MTSSILSKLESPSRNDWDSLPSFRPFARPTPRKCDVVERPGCRTALRWPCWIAVDLAAAASGRVSWMSADATTLPAPVIRLAFAPRTRGPTVSTRRSTNADVRRRLVGNEGTRFTARRPTSARLGGFYVRVLAARRNLKIPATRPLTPRLPALPRKRCEGLRVKRCRPKPHRARVS